MFESRVTRRATHSANVNHLPEFKGAIERLKTLHPRLKISPLRQISRLRRKKGLLYTSLKAGLLTGLSMLMLTYGKEAQAQSLTPACANPGWVLYDPYNGGCVPPNHPLAIPWTSPKVQNRAPSPYDNHNPLLPLELGRTYATPYPTHTFFVTGLASSSQGPVYVLIRHACNFGFWGDLRTYPITKPREILREIDPIDTTLLNCDLATLSPLQ